MADRIKITVELEAEVGAMGHAHDEAIEAAVDLLRFKVNDAEVLHDRWSVIVRRA